MREVADGVWMLTVRGNIVNLFLAGDVLIDAGMPWDGNWIRDKLSGHTVTAHAITHAHPDHMGSSASLCEQLGIPFWTGAGDAEIAEDPGRMARDFVPLPRTRISDAIMRRISGPGRPVDKGLNEGDPVGEFTVVETPGHTRGHISLWRESDRTLIAGDAIWNVPRLTAPFKPVNVDHNAVKASVRKLAGLEPKLTVFGHGPPVEGPEPIKQLAEGL